MFLVLVSFNNTVFGDDVKIYTMDDVIRDNKGIFFDKISNNKLNGILKFYNKSGWLQHESIYKDGKKNGVFKVYYESGELKQEALYKDGKLNGGDKPL